MADLRINELQNFSCCARRTPPTSLTLYIAHHINFERPFLCSALSFARFFPLFFFARRRHREERVVKRSLMLQNVDPFLFSAGAARTMPSAVCAVCGVMLRERERERIIAQARGHCVEVMKPRVVKFGNYLSLQ